MQAVNHPVLKITGTEKLPPDDQGSGEIYSRLGYTFSEAIADLVDNSIDAKAQNILIRFERTASEIRRVIILDDGKGITDIQLRKAMTVGAKTGKTDASLGKYGIGLKSASLSQAQSFKVLSLSGGKGAGRRWSLENIKNGWISEQLDGHAVAAFLSHSFGPVSIKKTGTMVVWEDLQHLKSSEINIDSTITKATKSILTELGLRFHRFLERNELNILIDTQVIGQVESGIHFKVSPLNPFSYVVSGHEAYPKTFNVNISNHGTLSVEAHIWPPKSNDIGYKLGGGKVSARQGFYFYRNDRLIQAGGWNGCREDDNEPHLSLARIAIDLPPTFDSTFQLDVTKSTVVPPPEFVPAIGAATRTDKATFAKYVKDAQLAYRTQKKKDDAVFKYVPAKGFPKAVGSNIGKTLWEKGSNSLKDVDFTWAVLAPTVFVELDRSNRSVVLNSLYRSKVLNGSSASAADAPLIKILLFFLFHDELDRIASSAKYRDWLDKVNLALIATCNKGL